ncbi:C40 family peptidase (plasmid) [Streptomyces sp. BI20]|uniref:C40 family peptidase n=1 Tax=Streptomyces sp. BI20 TaxID=3403460 RepID=UPI003C749416
MIKTTRRPRHAKPRSTRPATIRAGVLGGAIGTIALTALATPASAHQIDSGPAGDTATSRPDSGGIGTDSSTGEHVTGDAAAVVDWVRSQVGKAYVMGGTGPGAYDCSGLVQAAFRQAGVDLPRVSQEQSASGHEVDLSALRPGDLLYWGSSGAATHVAVYIGDGVYVGAQNSRTGVVKRTLDWDAPDGARRVL